MAGNDNLDTTFRPEELVQMKHYDKKTGEYRTTEYPKVGGRLRIAHAANSTLEITTEIIQYDGSVAVVKAVCSNDKGAYSGIGMASVDRDSKLADAILELAETRSIARSLRFAGYGVEFCSAEEISHLGNDKPSSPPANNLASQEDSFPDEPPVPNDTEYQHNGSNGGSGSNGKGRLSQKQHSFLLSLADERGLSRKTLDDMTKEKFGTVVSFLTKGNASSMIQEMTAH